MLLTQNEHLFSEHFLRAFSKRWLNNKHLSFSLDYTLYMDFWTRDKEKTLLMYKAATFLKLLEGNPFLSFFSKKQVFKHKFKADVFYFSNNLKFLMNSRHFLYTSIIKRRGDIKNIKSGIVFLDMSDFIKSNTIDFYQAKTAFRIMLRSSEGVEVLKSLFRFVKYGV